MKRRMRPQEQVFTEEPDPFLLDILEHPNPDRDTGQRIFVVQREDYEYLVPFVEDEHTVFLKTIILCVSNWEFWRRIQDSATLLDAHV